MQIYRTFAAGRYPRPCIAEMGGKNPVIVSRHADLDRRGAWAASAPPSGSRGRSARPASRIFVERPVKEQLRRPDARLDSAAHQRRRSHGARELARAGRRTRRRCASYESYCAELRQAGTILSGGRRLTQGALAKGYFCAPTLVDDVPADHRLWSEEMFLPITMIGAGRLAPERRCGAPTTSTTASPRASTGARRKRTGSSTTSRRVPCYANRPQGATTGAWPGLQPFGGWKGSGSTGKSAGGLYYLQQFMREQSRTLISEK